MQNGKQREHSRTDSLVKRIHFHSIHFLPSHPNPEPSSSSSSVPLLQENVRALTKGVQNVMGYKLGSGPVAPGQPGHVGPGQAGPEGVVGKPWKKHGNSNKKEKVRRLTRHLEA